MADLAPGGPPPAGARRILWFSDPVQAASGFGTQSWEVARRLAVCGWCVTNLAAATDPGRVAPSFDGIAVEPLPPDRHADPQALADAVGRHHPDVIVCLADLFMVPHLPTLRGVPWALWTPVDGEFLTDAWDATIRGATRLVALGEFGRAFLSRRRGAPVDVIPHGVDLDAFRPPAPAERQRFRAAQGWEGSFIALCVAKNQRRKGLGTLLEAWSSFARGRADARLILHTAPDSPGGWDLAALANGLGCAGSVGIHPRTLDRPALAALYGACDLFVLPTQGEGFGIPLLEAMACGRVVLSSACTAVPGVVGDAGDLVTPAAEEIVPPAMVRRHLVRAADLANRIAAWHDDWRAGSTLARLLGERARARAERSFGMESVATAWNALLREMVRA